MRNVDHQPEWHEKRFKLKTCYSWNKNMSKKSFISFHSLLTSFFLGKKSPCFPSPPKKIVHLSVVFLRPEKWSQTWPNVVQFLGRKISRWKRLGVGDFFLWKGGGWGEWNLYSWCFFLLGVSCWWEWELWLKLCIDNDGYKQINIMILWSSHWEFHDV